MKHMKFWAVPTLIIAVICSLIPLFIPVQAASNPLVKSASNPLVSSGISAGGETVIYDSSAGLYKMWYVQTANTDNTITSYLYGLLSPYPTLISDLKAGNYSAIAASPSELHDIKLALTSLAGLPTSTITGYVNSINTSLEYATSTDGITWSAPAPATFTTTTAWDQFISSVNVIKDGSTYKMWYTGFPVNASDLHNIFVDLNTIPSAGGATVLGDIISGNITKLQSDITSLSLKTPIESVLVDALTFASDSSPRIGYAESSNGTSWTKNGSNPVMSTGGSGDWDNLGVMTPSVIKNGSTYQMWYTGIQLGAGLATSLFAATSQSSLETALVNGVNDAICYATSPDGKTWTKNASPVLTRTSLGWDSYGVCAPSVVMNADGTYAMWYTCITGSVSSFFAYLNHTITLDSLFLNQTNIAIGHATSPDGTTWTQDGANPVLGKGSGSAWDNGGVAFPSVIATASNINLWYTGISASPSAALTSFLSGGNLTSILAGTGEKIGLASAVIPSSDATLSNLTISAGTLTPGFASGTTTYTDSVGNDITSVTVTPTVNESHATVKVNTVTVTSGSPSGAISLSVGSNSITIVVTAQNAATNTYTINVTVAAAPPPTTTTTTPTVVTITVMPSTTTSTTTTTTTTATTTTAANTTTPTTTAAAGQADLSLVVNDQGVFTQPVSVPTADGQVNLSIPAGTVGLNADGTPLSQISVLPANPPAPPAGSSFIGLAYDFEPSGATFSPPISMTFNLPSGVDETNLTVAFYNTTTGQWITVPTTIDPVTHTIIAQVSHFTTYTVMAATASTTPAPTSHTALIWTIIIIVIGLLVIAGVVIWVLRRKK